MSAPKQFPCDVYLLGTGMIGARQITYETAEALKRCEQILYLHHDASVREYLEQLGISLEDLGPLYREDLPRPEIYRNIAEEVMSAGLRNPPVSFITYGHPLVFVAPTKTIAIEGPRRGLRVKTLPAISSMDGLFIDLNLDPGVEGLQMYEATDLLVRRRPLQADVPALIWQIGALETIHYLAANSKPERFERFKSYLMEFYPANHVVTITATSTLPIAKPKLIQTPLSELQAHHAEIGVPETLYIPPVEHRPIKDEVLRQLVESKDHLRGLVEVSA